MKHIVKGIKLAGKPILADRLFEYSMVSTVINYQAYTKSNPRPYAIHKDIFERLLSFARFLKKHSNEPFTLTRAHVYPFALAKSVCQNMWFRFSEIDKKFKMNDICLVLSTVNKQSYLSRLNQRFISNRKEKDWDKDTGEMLI